ncbi:MAG: 4Fe-4S cluster-binding domain-containing protein [Oscillospiraceae bacterium]|nr:4Fe-4S cluster-binding domain-containing protein [Oscillospiraceae bacterium]
MDSLKPTNCSLCPRRCSADRKNSIGFCGEKDTMRLAKASLHHWEEPCISGKNGAGTVFFSGCNLGCVYCQNYKISHGGFGKEVTPAKLRSIFERLIEAGAHNIELITPTHFVPQLKEALTPSLPVPVIYNSGGYEAPKALRLLDGLIDIYMPDMKYSIAATAKKYSRAEDYPEINTLAIEEMYRQVGDCKFSSDGLLKKGVLVRHLILPSNLLNTKGVIKSFAQLSEGRKMLFSLMAQYTPCKGTDFNKFPELSRPLLQKELDSALRYLERFPQIEGYTQALCSSDEAFIPDFDLGGI